MTVRPAGTTSAGPLSADVPLPPERPPWQPSPAPSPVPPVTPVPLCTPVRNLPDPPGRHGQLAAPWRSEPREGQGIYDRLLARRIVMAHGQLDDEAATRLCAQLLTLDAEGDEPIRFELQNLGAGLSAALTVMGVLDVVGVPVQARAAGQISGPALGVLAACGQRCAYPNAVFVLSEPTMEFDGTMMAITAREEQIRTMLDALYFRLAEVTGREVDEIRGDARAHRILTAGEAQRYGLLTGQIERDRAPRPQNLRLRPRNRRLRPQDRRLRPQDQRLRPQDQRLRPQDRRLRPQDRRLRPQDQRLRPQDRRLRPSSPPEAPSRPRSGRVTSAPGKARKICRRRGRRVVSAYCAAMRPQSHHMTPCLTREGGGERDRGRGIRAFGSED